MNPTKQIANQLRTVHFGKNWTWVDLKATLADVTWQQATAKVYSLNSIAALVFHINYYISAVLKVLEGGPLDASDKYSFDVPPVRSQADWEALLNKTWTDAENLAARIEELPEEKLDEIFSEEKYGTYYRNLHGVIEHAHYHLGQIVLLKKIIAEKEKSGS